MRGAPHPFSLRQLQYLCAVAETGSFRRAAERCRVSQPSLSSQLAAAERALGVRVFERNRRGVLITAAGEELLERARRVLLEADNLLEAAARRRDPLSGTLRIGLIPTVSPYFLPEAAPALRRALPRLTIVWSEDKTAALVAALHAGELDAALMALPLDALEHEVIGRDPFVLAAPPQHPLARSARPLRKQDLDGVDLLVLTEGHCLRDQALAACKRAHQSELGATSLPTLVQMVAGGAGVTLLPELALAAENRRGLLHLRHFAAPGPGRTLALAWRPGSPLVDLLRQIAAVMRDQLVKRRRGGAAPGDRRASRGRD